MRDAGTAPPFEGSLLAPTRTCGDSGGRTKRGMACRQRMNLSPTTGLCPAHDPDRAEAARAAAAAGGNATAASNRRNGLPRGIPRAPKTIEDAARFASWLTRAICDGTIDPRTGREAAAALREFRGATEKRTLEAQVKALRAELAAAKKERST